MEAIQTSEVLVCVVRSDNERLTHGDVLALLDEPRTAGRSLDLIGGDVPIDEAVAALVGSGAP